MGRWSRADPAAKSFLNPTMGQRRMSPTKLVPNPRFRRRIGFRFAWAAAALVGCGAPNVYQPPPPPAVQTANPVRRDVTRYMEQTGTTQPSERVELRPRISGFLLERKFEDGDAVKAGQLLFVIDEEPFLARMQIAAAKVGESKAALKKAEQSKAREIAAAQVALSESETTLARRNLERGTKLIERNSVVQQEVEQFDAALRKAEAQLLASKAQRDQAEANYSTDVASAKAALELAQAELRAAEIEYAYCRITSPIDGVIDRRNVDVGNYVSSASSTVLATIVGRDPIYAYAAISEEEFARLARNYPDRGAKRIPIKLGVGDDSSFPFDGEIDYIAPSVSTGTGTVQLRGVFKNDSGKILPGSYVRVRIPAEKLVGATLVPERAIARDQVGAYVYVVDAENKVARRDVKPGDLVGGERVVEGTLAATDRVVVDGLSRVRPGVVVATAAPAPAQAARAEGTPPGGAEAASTLR